MGLALGKSIDVPRLSRCIGVKISMLIGAACQRVLSIATTIGLELEHSSVDVYASFDIYQPRSRCSQDTALGFSNGYEDIRNGWVDFCGPQGLILLKVRTERHLAPLTLLKIMINKAQCLQYSTLNTRSLFKHKYSLALSHVSDKFVLDMLLIYSPFQPFTFLLSTHQPQHSKITSPTVSGLPILVKSSIKKRSL